MSGKISGNPEWNLMVQYETAMSDLVECRADVERLTKERDEWQQAFFTLSEQFDAAAAEVERVQRLAIEFAEGHACDGEDFDAFVKSLGEVAWAT
jgi:multidrug resistance efflux pump